MTGPLFSLWTILSSESNPQLIQYDTIEDCLNDPALAKLFDGEVVSCAIYCGSKKICGIGITTFDRLIDAVVSNATAILRERYTRKDG